MSTKNGGSPPIIRSIGWYQLHPRIKAPNFVVNPITGECTVPPSMTKQEFVAQCDINNILKSFKLTGMISHINAQAAQGRYMDLPEDVDYQSSLHTVKAAQEAFQSLPAKVRDRFNHDPAQFLGFMADKANIEEIYTLGLATRPRPAAPAPSTPAAPATPPDGSSGPAPAPAA